MLFGHLDTAPGMLKPLLEFDRRRYAVSRRRPQAATARVLLLAHARRRYDPCVRAAVATVGRADSHQSRGQTPACCPRTTTPATSTSKSTRSTRTPTAGGACATWPRCSTKWARRTKPSGFDRRPTAIARRFSTPSHAASAATPNPPFIPVRTAFRRAGPRSAHGHPQGSYYDLMCPYVIGSEIFGQGSDREDWLLGLSSEPRRASPWE